MSSRSRFKDKSLSSVISGKKSRTTCCTTLKINCIRLCIFALFSFPIQFSYVSSVSRIRVEFVSQENLFHDRISSFVSRKKKKKKKSFRSFSTQTGIPSRFPISESKFTSVGLIDRFGSPYQLRARYREVFSRYATVAANFRESKWRLRTVLLSFYRWPLANGTAVRHAFVHKECAYHTSIYIYLLTPLPAPSCASSRDRK